jgi:predicted DNA-binding ribbon-helix-helix protein
MTKLSVSLSGHQTSISLEREFIDALRDIARADKTSVAQIIKQIDEHRDANSNLSSEIRLYILRRLTRR